MHLMFAAVEIAPCLLSPGKNIETKNDVCMILVKKTVKDVLKH